MESNSKFLFIDLYGTGTQDVLEDILLNHGRLRDQYCCHASYDADFPINVILANIVASYFNVTLITNGYSNGNEDQEYPVMLPVVQVVGGMYEINQTMENFAYTNNISKVVEYPSLNRSEQIDYNFGYCALPTKMWNSNWDFRIFCDPFSISTWLILLLTLILVTIFISFLWRHKFFSVLFSAIACILANNMPLNLKSKTFVLWLLTSVLMLQLYSGSITSHVIARPGELQLTKIKHLSQENYSIVFPGPPYLTSVRKSVAELLNANFSTESVRILSRLLKNAKAFGYMTEEFSTKFVEQDHVATLIWWPHV